MDTTYLRMNMLRGSFLSTCKVCCLLLTSTNKLVRTIHIKSGYITLLMSGLSTGEAEAGLERLHQCAEKDLQTYLNAEEPSKDFNDFRTKLTGLTR